MRKTALWRILALGTAVALSVAATACGGGDGGESGVSNLSGAGASFPDPVYQQIFQAYNEDTGVQVNYDPIGSGGGREEFINNTVDFAGSDAPMDGEELRQAGGSPVHIPTVGGAVVMAYNVPGLDQAQQELKLTGGVISQIFLGEITSWNDPAIQELNPDLKLPSADITVVHRSDGSGTTEIFTTYLASVSQAWADGPGASDETDWPTGVGGEGNDGVTQQISQTENSIGYVGLEYAEGDGGGLPYASVSSSPDGPFVKPATATASNTIDAVSGELPPSLDEVLTQYTPDAQGENLYPITSITWLLVRTEMEDAATCQGVAKLAHYMITDGQKLAPENNYVPLPESLARKSQGQIEKMRSGGEACYEGSGLPGGGATTMKGDVTTGGEEMGETTSDG